jgi:hypothetical protein
MCHYEQKCIQEHVNTYNKTIKNTEEKLRMFMVKQKIPELHTLLNIK